jgi:hypothetical protein
MKRRTMKMEYLKVAVDPRLKKDLKLIVAERGGSLSHLVSEILWQYVMMPEVKIPVAKIPERMAEKTADKMMKAALADEMELKDHQTPTPR